MNFSDFFISKDHVKLDKKTLLILRWLALIGQLFTINYVFFIFNFNFPFFYCLVIIIFGIASNLYLQFKIKNNQLSNLTSTAFLLYDLIQLGALLYLTGGVTNPFAILLIIPAIVSSTFLSLQSTVNLSILTIVILFVITISHFDLPHEGELHFHFPDYYLYAIPIAIIIGLVFLTYFGFRFGEQSRKRIEALNKLELILAKEHELESIGLQAAAAAHSLGTPLSTINVTAKELAKDLGENSEYSKDINLILSQTKRCSEILKNLSQDELKNDSFVSNIRIGDLLDQVVRSFVDISNKKILLFNKDNEYNPEINRTLEITYGLRNFIGNAVKYSNSIVEIRLTSNRKITEVEVNDDGPGFSEDIKNILGEPYIRSKNKIISSKSGLGLGTFIGKTLLERMKAKVEFGSSSKLNGALVKIKWETKKLSNI